MQNTRNHWASWLTSQPDSSIALHISVVVLNGAEATFGYPADSRSMDIHWQWSLLFILRKLQTKFVVGLFFYPTLPDFRNNLPLKRVPRLRFFVLMITARHVTNTVSSTGGRIQFVCLFTWRYKPLWLYFHSPVVGFSLLVFEVSWSHTTTRHSR